MSSPDGVMKQAGDCERTPLNDAWLLGGPGTFDERLDQLDELGVDVVRVNLRWDEIAAKRPAKPSSHLDPAYDWAVGDVLLGGLRARGITPVVTLVGTALPVRAALGDLERAEQVLAAPPDEPEHLRATVAQPGL